MPGQALRVERELRWRIKQAFDGAGIRIIGGLPAQPDEEAAPDPTAGMAAPSAYSNPRPRSPRRRPR